MAHTVLSIAVHLRNLRIEEVTLSKPSSVIAVPEGLPSGICLQERSVFHPGS
jgi:hypothetical protein